MKTDSSKGSAAGNSGIKLNHLNVVLICIGLAICALMVVTMYQTTVSVNEIVTVTDNYLIYQQTGGKLQSVSKGMSETALAFVHSGEPGAAFGYQTQLGVVEDQLALYSPEQSTSEAANQYLETAVNAYRARCAIEVRAMRLAADSMPPPKFEALPDFLKNAELSEEDKALSPEEKTAAAVKLLSSEEYTAWKDAIDEAVDGSHRLSSEQGQLQAAKTSARVKSIVRQQKILIFMFVVVAVVALLLNRTLIISPISKSVDNLDRREPIPVRGSYEMRHLASVYNEVLKDNERKKEALSYTASHDALTSLYNRAAFDKAYAAFEDKDIGVIIADVDRFKQYNDSFGHDVGDRVLVMAADALKKHFRDEDHISRIGGDEFCVIMPGMDQSCGEDICRRIRQINQELAENSGDLPPVTLSAGIAFWNRPNPSGSIFKDADSALLDIKKKREDCCAVYQG